MTKTALGVVLRHLSGLAAGQDDPTPDDQLLRRFAATQDEATFEALLRRHGPMVLGVCRRLLRCEQDAEDVFQATFLVLACKAGSVRCGQSLAPWLYGVARRLASDAGTAAARRTAIPIGEVAAASRDPATELSWREVRGALDEELAQLPEALRAPLVLCYLEGMTRDEAAARLGCPLGTLKGRLERGRDLLRRRLTRRGLALSAALAALALDPGAVPAALGATTARAATGFAAGTPTASVPAALAGTALRSMVLTKGKVAAALLLGLVALAAGAGLMAPPRPEAPPAPETKADRPVGTATRSDVFGDPLPAGALARMGTVRLRHADNVLCTAFCPDGKSLITGSHDGTLRQWSLADARQVRHFGGHGFAIRHMALSPDGKLLAAWGQTPPGVYLWHVATGKGGLRIPVATQGECCLAWSPDNQTLAAGGEDGTLRLWDTTTSRELRSVAAHKRQIACVAFAPDGKRLATAGRDGTLRLFNMAGQQEPQTLRAREKEYHFVAFAPDGKTLISAGDCYSDKISSKTPGVNTVAVWDAATGERRRDFRVGDDQDDGHKDAASVALAPGGTTLALGYWDHTIRLWDLASGKPLRKLTEFPDRFYPAYHVAFSPDGQTLAAAGSHHTVCLLDIVTGKRLLKDRMAQERDIRSVALSTDGQLLATGSPDQTIVLWDAATGKSHRELRGHDGWVYSVALTMDARTVVSGGSDGTVRLWEAATGKELRKFLVPFDPPRPLLGTLSVRKVAVSPDGKLLASSHSQSGPGMVLNGPDGIRLWDTARGKELRKLQGSSGDPCFLSFSADGKVVIAANSDRSTVHRWDAATGKEVGRCSPLGEARVYAIAVTADVRLAALSDFEGRIAVADVVTGQTLFTIRRPGGQFCTLAFSADGRFLALADGNYRGNKGRAELWEVASGKRVCEHALPPDNGAVSTALSADGRTLVTGMHDTTALVWDLAPALPRDVPRRAEDLWAALAGDDAARAYQALLALAAAPDEALPLLRRKVRPAAGVDRKRVLALIADLDSDAFAVRERAAQALEEWPEADPVFAEVLSGRPSAEVRRRLESLRGPLPLPVRSARDLRSLRAIVVLERIGTPKPRRLLELLAKGEPAARQTVEAKAALERLANRQQVAGK